jgi:hypothetical protein
LSAAVLSGLILGFFIGGVGSRLAMRALILTSPPGVRGMTSDDGFIIGRFTLSNTLGLVVLGTVIGLLGGVAYLAMRRFLPPSMAGRSLCCALFYGLIGGANLVHSDGIDFRVLLPRWFAVALFVAIPTLFGALLPLLFERLHRPGGVLDRGPEWRGLLPLAALAFPPVLVIAGVGILVFFGAWLLSRRVDALRRFVDGPAFLWLGRTVLVGIGTAALAFLYLDVYAIIL